MLINNNNNNNNNNNKNNDDDDGEKEHGLSKWQIRGEMKMLFQTNVGPILVCVNPYTDVGNPLTLTSTRSVPLAPQLNKVVQEAVRQQSETGYPQAIILSGKTERESPSFTSLLRNKNFRGFFRRDKWFRENVRLDAATQAALRRRRRRTGNGRFQTPSGSFHGP
jgi:hypothetical protein